MSRNFPASLEKLYEMLAYIKECITPIGFGESIESKIELACEEALVNIISYGYPTVGEGMISILCNYPSGNGIKIIIKDNGIPYNPLTNTKPFNPKLFADNNGTPNGGYGVFFILKLMDEVYYRRENNSNILILVKFKTRLAP